jgi:hypothetical protein
VGRSVGGWTVGDVERSLWVVVIGMKDESRCIRYADCSATGANKWLDLLSLARRAATGHTLPGYILNFLTLENVNSNFPSLKVTQITRTFIKS